jgi:hypothetical protein
MFEDSWSWTRNRITYSVNGMQYVAVPTGWGGWIKGFAPKMFGQELGSASFVFALPEESPCKGPIVMPNLFQHPPSSGATGGDMDPQTSSG